jgi:hypothetical protein
MEHALHPAAKHFVQTIALCSRKCGHSGGSGSDSDSETPSDGDEDDNNEDDDVLAGDSLGKAIALVKQVSHYVLLNHVLYDSMLQIHKSPQAWCHV